MTTFRHKKTGGLYTTIAYGRMQSALWLEQGEGTIDQPSPLHSVDMREVVVYQSQKDLSVWVRPREEFEDGRFEQVSN